MMAPCFLPLLLAFLVPDREHARIVVRPDDPGALERPAWAQEVPCCCMRRLPPPREARIRGYEAASCIPVGSGSRVCKCRLESPEDIGFEMRYEVDGNVLARWPTVGFLGDVEDFDAWRGDLDDDGREELFVFSRLAETNGMGVQVWSAVGVDLLRPEARPEDLIIEDHPFFVPFTGLPEGGPCRLLATRWINLPGQDSLWLVGRWYDLEDGRLVRDAGSPVIARRYLLSFEADRADVWRGSQPLTWHRAAGVLVVPVSTFDELKPAYWPDYR